MRLLWRLAIMLAAYLASAAAVVPLVLALLVLIELEQPTLDLEMLTFVVIAYILLIALTCVPALLVVAAAEWKRIRHWRYFVTAGGLIALVLLTILGFVPDFRQGGPSLFLSVFLFVAGLLAGWIYWAIAGKASGRLRDAWAARRTA